MPVCVSCGDPVPVVAANAAAGGIVVQAYSPLGSGTLLHDPLLKTIGSAHAKSPAQVALRWLLQHKGRLTLLEKLDGVMVRRSHLRPHMRRARRFPCLPHFLAPALA